MRDHEDDDDNRRERWKKEAAFFDSAAEHSDIGPVDPRVVARYGTPSRVHFSKEFRYSLMGNLAGLRILDIGCGDGENAITLAVLGASVVGIDVSPGAIEVCRRRAEVNGVADRTTFICAPLEEPVSRPISTCSGERRFSTTSFLNSTRSCLGCAIACGRAGSSCFPSR